MKGLGGVLGAEMVSNECREGVAGVCCFSRIFASSHCVLRNRRLLVHLTATHGGRGHYSWLASTRALLISKSSQQELPGILRMELKVQQSRAQGTC